MTMAHLQDIVIQGIGFVGLLFFFISFQLKTNKLLFSMQTIGCLCFSLQFALLGAYSGCLNVLINIIRNALLIQYNNWKFVRWKGWVVIFSALSIAIALFTWDGAISILPVAGTISGTVGYWTNNAKKIRIANLFVNSPCMLIYDALVRSWGGVLNEGITIASIVISIIRFGWKSLDGDKIQQ